MGCRIPRRPSRWRPISAFWPTESDVGAHGYRRNSMNLLILAHDRGPALPQAGDGNLHADPPRRSRTRFPRWDRRGAGSVTSGWTCPSRTPRPAPWSARLPTVRSMPSSAGRDLASIGCIVEGDILQADLPPCDRQWGAGGRARLLGRSSGFAIRAHRNNARVAAVASCTMALRLPSAPDRPGRPAANAVTKPGKVTDRGLAAPDTPGRSGRAHPRLAKAGA